MAASDNLNPKQFERYGGGYYAKPKNAENIATPAKPRYSGLASAATNAAQAEARRRSQIRKGA
jgi:hypothetical protein